MIKLNTDIKKIHNIANKLNKDFNKIGIKTVEDLLWFFPKRYDDLSQIKKIEDLEENKLTIIKVKINNIKTYRSPRKKMLITKILASDNTDSIEVMYFRQKFVGQILKTGDEIYLSGKAQKKHLIWQLINPTYEKVKKETLHSARLVPIYHLSGKITQKQLRFLINLILKNLENIEDPLPVDILNKEKFTWLHEALQEIHFPNNKNKLNKAIERLKFQELFYIQCKYQLAKKDYQNQKTFKIPINNKITEKVKKDLPFILTNDQENTLNEIATDMNKNYPMNRLLEGDVGSGKTIVAILSSLNILENKLQVALMAPTEILAQQHFKTIKKILPKKYKKNIALLTKNQYFLGDNDNITKKELLNNINNNKAKFIIGTHSLIQEKTKFHKLGLVVIDEQHRFGVKQRQNLKEKNINNFAPHLLSMTATPIPRTLSLTLYGDLDISIIKEKIKGRKNIKTILVPESKRNDAYNFIKEKIKNKEQIFIICPLIDDSDSLGVKSVTTEYDKLKDIFLEKNINILHGKLKSEEKKKIMENFQNNKFPILISTSVIEVGVDIPQATIMIIESSERFGLSQLHQFRGRIGRNALESFCLLFTTDKSQLNIKRLKALINTNDGFKLSELDLKLRGSGEIFGTKQTGLMKLNIAKLSDTEIIKRTQKWALRVLANKNYLRDKNFKNLLSSLKTEIHLE